MEPTDDVKSQTTGHKHALDAPDDNPNTKQQRVASVNGLDTENLCFSLCFTLLSNFNQMMEIISNVHEIKSCDHLTFDIVRDPANDFEGIMVNRDSQLLLFYGRLKCRVEYLDPDPSYSYFRVPLKRFLGLVSNIDTSYTLTISKYKSDTAKLYLVASSPDQSGAAMREEFWLQEVAVDESTNASDYLQNLTFANTIQMPSDKLKKMLARAERTEVDVVEFVMESVCNSNGSDSVKMFSVRGDNDTKDAGVNYTKMLSVQKDENGNSVHEFDVREAPAWYAAAKGKGRIIDSARYPTKLLHEIIKNMKAQSVLIAFGEFSFKNDQGDVFVENKTRPCLVDLSLGDPTSYLRFLLYSRKEDDGEDNNNGVEELLE